MTTITQRSVESYISTSDNFFANNTNQCSKIEIIKNRARYGTGVVLAPITCTIDSIAGLFLGIGAILTGGTKKKLNEKAIEFSNSGGQTLHYLFRGCLGLMRPGYSPDELQETITQAFCAKVDAYNSQLIKSENKLNKHVLSRVIFFSATVLSVFTTITDLAIGVLAGFGALLALGKVDWLNDLAWIHLKESISAPIYEFFIKTINVHAKFGETDQ